MSEAKRLRDLLVHDANELVEAGGAVAIARLRAARQALADARPVDGRNRRSTIALMVRTVEDAAARFPKARMKILQKIEADRITRGSVAFTKEQQKAWSAALREHVIIGLFAQLEDYAPGIRAAVVENAKIKKLIVGAFSSAVLGEPKRIWRDKLLRAAASLVFKQEMTEYAWNAALKRSSKDARGPRSG